MFSPSVDQTPVAARSGSAFIAFVNDCMPAQLASCCNVAFSALHLQVLDLLFAFSAPDPFLLHNVLHMSAPAACAVSCSDTFVG